MAFDLDPAYKQVPERIADFKAKHPEGCLRPLNPERPFWIETMDGRLFVCYAAAAYRTPDDPLPGVGVAWEPYPGKTPYTRDSELQNAETSAWGRAIVAVLASESKSVASAEDVRNRRADEEAAPTRRVKPSKAGPALPSATDMQYLAITSLIDDLSDKEKAALMAWWAERSMPSLKKRELSTAHADTVLAELERILEERPKGAPIEPESEAPVGVAGPTRTGGSARNAGASEPGNGPENGESASSDAPAPVPSAAS